MSAWKRHALQAIPERQDKIQRAKSFEALLGLLLEFCQAPAEPDSKQDLTEAVGCLVAGYFCPGNDARRQQVLKFFYRPLLKAPRGVHLLPNGMTRTQFRKVLKHLQTDLSAEVRAELQAVHSEYLAWLEEGTDVGNFSQIHDQTLAANPGRHEDVQRIWDGVLSCLDAGELRIALQDYLVNFLEIDVEVPESARSQLDSLLVRYKVEETRHLNADG